MKRVLSLVLALVLVLGMMPTFAADTTATGAASLYQYGFITGANGDLMVEKSLTRAEMAVVLSELFGVKEAAASFAVPANFTDVNEHWAKSYIAYGQEAGWFGGYPDGTYMPEGVVSGNELAAFVLNALGYNGDYTFAEAVDFAATLGIAIPTDAALTRGTAFESVWSAVNTPMKGSDVTLGVYLGKLQPVVVEPKDLEVVSVTADNLVQIFVTFNKAVDEDTAEDLANYDLDDNAVTIAKAELQDDGVTVKLTTSASAIMENYADYTLTIEDVEDLDENVVADTDVDFTAADAEMPYIVSATYTGPQTIKFTFSEPIDRTAASTVGTSDYTVEVDGGEYAGNIATSASSVSTSVTVDLGADLDEGEHTFTIKGLEDFAGIPMAGKTMTADYAEITSAPTATIVEMDQKYIVIEFDRDVTNLTREMFYQTYSSWNPYIITDDEVADEATLIATNDYTDTVKLWFDYDAAVDVLENANQNNASLGASPVLYAGVTYDEDDEKLVPAGDAVKVGILEEDENGESLEDYWNNTLDNDIVLYDAVSADTTAPTVKKVTVPDDDTVRIYFSEGMDVTEAETESNYTFYDADGDKISRTDYVIGSGSYNSTNDYVEATFSADVLEAGTYKIVITDLIDDSLQENPLGTTTLTFDYASESGIDLSDVDVTFVQADNILYVKFPDAVDSASATNYNNYYLSNSGTKVDLSSSKFSMYTSKIVKITVDDDEWDFVASVPTGADSLTVANVKDTAGNLPSKLSVTVTLGSAETAVQVKKIKLVEDNKLEIVLDGELKSVDKSGIKVSLTGDLDNLYTVSTATFSNDGDDTVLKLTMSASTPSMYGTHDTLFSTTDKANFILYIADESVKTVTNVYMEGIYTLAGNTIGEIGAGTQAAPASLAMTTTLTSDADFDTLDGDDDVIVLYSGWDDDGTATDIAVQDKVAPEIVEVDDVDAEAFTGGALATSLGDIQNAFAFDIDGGVADGLMDFIIIEYTEDIDANTLSKYTFDAGDYDVDSAAVYSDTSLQDIVEDLMGTETVATAAGALDGAVAGDGTFVVLMVSNGDLESGDDDTDAGLTLSYVTALSDVAGNDAAFDEIEVLSVDDSTAYLQ